MKKIKFLILASFALLAGCQEGDSGTDTRMPGRIEIDPVITRATEVNFEEGDVIGLTVAKADESLHADNKSMTFTGGVFSSDLLWYAEGNDAAHLTAYYPYNSTGAPTSFTVSADQNAGDGYENSDLMGASKADVLPSANAVGLTFKHLLSKIVVNVTNESGSDISSVVLQGSVPAADVDLKALTATADENASAADIKAQEVTANSAYRAIVVPQTVAFTVAVKTSDDKTLTQKLTSVTLAQGGQYSVDVRVLADGIHVTMSGEIENWTDKGEIGPDNGDVPFEEFEGYFVYDGETYNTVVLSNGQKWMAEPLRYVPEGYTPSADPTVDAHIWYPYKMINDGGTPSSITPTGTEALTDEASVKKNGYLYDAYVALGGVEITEANCYDYEGVQGICPTGWRVPTREDFFNLCGLSNKNALGESGNQTNTSALFYDTGYLGGKWTLYNDAGWNYVLTGARQQNGFSATPAYQASQLWSGNTNSNTDLYELPALTYMLSSTCYKPNYSTTSGELTNIQFFSQMTTFTSLYPLGRINVAYVSIMAGTQIRCVKN